MSEKIEATVQRTFLHDNKTVRRGDKITGSKAVIQQLITRKLVTSGGAAAEQPKGSPGASALLDQNANVVIAAVGKVTDVQKLKAALEAEKAEGGKQRKSVIEAIEAAIAAAEQPKG